MTPYFTMTSVILLSQLNALQTLPSSISATMKSSEMYGVKCGQIHNMDMAKYTGSVYYSM